MCGNPFNIRLKQDTIQYKKKTKKTQAFKTKKNPDYLKHSYNNFDEISSATYVIY